MRDMDARPGFGYEETGNETVVTVKGSSRLADAAISLLVFCVVAAFLFSSRYFEGALSLIEDAREIGVQPPLSAFVTMAFGGIMLAWTFIRALRRAFGVERLVMGNGSVTYRFSLFGLGRTSTWPLAEVTSVRALSHEILSGTAKATYRAMGIRSAVRFDHGNRTITLFKDIDEASARSIAGILTQAKGNHP